MSDDYIELLRLEMQVAAAQTAKEIDEQILAAVIKEAEKFEQYMLSDELFEI